MLNVLHVVPSTAPDRGGPSRSVLGLAQAESRVGATVEFAAARGDEAGAAEGRGQVRLHGGRHLPIPLEIPGPSLARTLWKAIGRADIVHLHSVWNGTITMAEWMCRARRVPYILSPRGMLDAHNMKAREKAKRAAYRLVERGNLEAVAGWHFLDPTEREGCSWIPAVANAERVLVAPNGLEVEAIEAAANRAPAQFPAPEGETINLVFLGRIHPIKGLELVLEAVRELADRGVRCVLHLVGPDDGCLASLLDHALALHLSDRVRHWGPVYGEDRFGILRHADAVVLASHYECNSVTAAETIAAGGLLIATETCHLDVARAAGAAVVVRRDRQAFADAIGQWATDRARSDAVRRKARRFAQDHLAWPALAARMVEFYRQVLESRRCAA
jgi:glycosyltransferase involved in cell wall biosynthesis